VGIAVAAPDGRVWEVRRVWARRPRWREVDLGDLSPADALTFADGDIGGGWRRSRRAVREVADALRAGTEPSL
jgi:hypothetical protein